ncbi:MAG: hypothetical protein ABSG51_14545 [Terracidiphilus sp.]|jgi:hypothetical protein
MDYRKSQTTTATPPEAGDLPLPLAIVAVAMGDGGAMLEANKLGYASDAT